MKLTSARLAGLVSLAGQWPNAGRVSNVTSKEAGYVYWQTAEWLFEHQLAYSPRGAPTIALTPRGHDILNGLPWCRDCGCTENSACDEGCSWVEPDLCSSCSVKAAA